ncbi:Small RNA degrading nuclease 3 [Platanthera zijinensis]|uniref:Small RNA degrading nuclease 3 n=1 Tax=Platanthera zijinensis TaxID=2320716 RepID=A0AAP0BEA9_9ASPA
MEEIVTSTLETMVSGVDKEVLVEIVKVIQKRGLSGSQGDWKNFLNFYDKKFGDSLSDPSKRSVDVLSAFIKCFNQPKYVKFFGDIIRQYTNYKALDKYSSQLPDEESPQQKLVRLTMKHPLYRKHYSFRFFDDKDWVVVPTYYKSKGKKSKNMLAVDCEMVLCHDDTEEVVEVCVVDKKLKVMLKSLVKPSKPVADYRTEITGVSAEDLEGVTCSFSDIQKSMVKLLRSGTILVGHSVHSDLRVLKIVHHRVIDTAYIFKFSEGPPTCTPSLNSLCEAVLGYKVRKEGEPHDCRKDAESAMRLVLAKLEHGFDDLINATGVPEFNSPVLLLHKIPAETSWQELHKIFPQNFNFEIQDNLKRQGSFYSTRACFKDPSEAIKAFQSLKGQEEKDSVGHLQKLVYLKLSTGETTGFYVRQTTIPPTPEDTVSVPNNTSSNIAAILDSKRRKTTPSSAEIGEGRDRKAQRNHLSAAATDNNQDSCSKTACLSETCEHADEISRLRRELIAREEEIFKLQKILAGHAGRE